MLKCVYIVKGGGKVLNDQMEKLYREYYREVYLYALSLCKDYHLAQDLTAEAFYRAYLSVDEAETYIKYWLFKVCKNLYVDFLRKNREDSYTEPRELSQGEENSPLEKLIKGEENRRLYSAILRLGEGSREILILYYFGGYSVKEIAKVRRMTENAVKTTLFRARRQLRSDMEDKNGL